MSILLDGAIVIDDKDQLPDLITPDFTEDPNNPAYPAAALAAESDVVLSVVG